MRFPTLLVPCVLLLAGDLAAQTGQTRLETQPTRRPERWDPFFDYTNLRPSDDEIWTLLSNVTVPLETAIEVAKTAEGNARVARADLVQGETLHWNLQLFVEKEGKGRRVDVQVAAAEPKVLKRVELLSFAPGEEEMWSILSASAVPLETMIPIVKEAARGQKEKDVLLETRVSSARFAPEEKNPHWDIEIFGLDAKSQLVRRFHYQTSATTPVIQRKFLRDRFPGEPLRKNKPTQLENGLWVHDFTTGDGPLVTAESKTQVNYRLFLLDDTKLKDTYDAKQTETFVVADAPLRGMAEGMVGMRVGGRRKIAMPYTMAFGEESNELAPRKAMIVCDIAVVSIEP